MFFSPTRRRNSKSIKKETNRPSVNAMVTKLVNGGAGGEDSKPNTTMDATKIPARTALNDVRLFMVFLSLK